MKDRLGISNFTEDAVFQAISDCDDFKCKCDRCKADAACIALNALAPKYVSTLIGEVYVKFSAERHQYTIDASQEVMKAVEIVNSRPSHE